MTERVFKTAWFAKAAKKARISDNALAKAIHQVALGQAGRTSKMTSFWHSGDSPIFTIERRRPTWKWKSRLAYCWR